MDARCPDNAEGVQEVFYRCSLRTGVQGVARDNNTTRDYSARFIDELRLRFHPEPFTFLPCCVSLGTMTTAVSPWYEFEGVL
jgi:hypothetical protein